ncbi:hypothetical protein ACHAWT_010498 [Skeletonema menzelii]
MSSTEYTFSTDTGGVGHTLLDSFAQPKSSLLARRDEDILSRTVQDCGLHAYGAIFVELWVLSSDGTLLRRPPGGSWMDPQFIYTISPPSLAEQANEQAQPCAPGVSLAGSMYLETSQWGNWGINRKVYWRQIKSMMDDPFLQDDGRLKSLYEDLGIGIVATVPFSFHGRSGIVMFMSRSTCNIDRLRSTANENFLIAAADLCGASFTIRIPRKKVANIRKDMMRSAVRKLMKQIKSNKGRNHESIVANMKNEGMLPTKSFANAIFNKCSDVTDGAGTPEIEDSHGSMTGRARCRNGWPIMSNIAQRVSRRIVNSIRKWEGARLKGPARMKASECVTIFLTSTVAMLAILRMNDAIENAQASPDNIFKWDINGAWYASTLCIVFALSSAPVGQPRQIIGAHLINAFVGLAFQQIPTTFGMYNFEDFASIETGERKGMPLFWRVSLAVGVGISAQAWLGVMHPPATGLAFSFAYSNRYEASNVAVVLLADLIIIALATGLLNLQKNKQYPLFWLGLSWKYPSGKKPAFMEKNKRRQPQDHKSFSATADSTCVENV